MTPRHHRERASAVLVVPMVLALVVVSMVGLARIGIAATETARADAVADVVALAAVSSAADASAVATRNGATLRAAAPTGTSWVVTIELAGVESTAAARAAG